MSGALGQDGVANDPFGDRRYLSLPPRSRQHRPTGNAPRRFRPLAALHRLDMPSRKQSVIHPTFSVTFVLAFSALQTAVAIADHRRLSTNLACCLRPVHCRSAAISTHVAHRTRDQGTRIASMWTQRSSHFRRHRSMGLHVDPLCNAQHGSDHVLIRGGGVVSVRASVLGRTSIRAGCAIPAPYAACARSALTNPAYRGAQSEGTVKVR